MPRADLHLVLELRDPRPQSSDIAAANRMLRHLFSAARRQRCNQPGRSTKFQRDENRAKIGADSGRRLGSVSDNLHGRLQSGWSATSLCQSVGRYPLPMGSLLIDRQDNGVVGRIDVEADDLVQFGGKLRIVGQLELAHPVRLEAMSTPYPLHRADANPVAFAIAEPLQ